MFGIYARNVLASWGRYYPDTSDRETPVAPQSDKTDVDNSNPSDKAPNCQNISTIRSNS